MAVPNWRQSENFSFGGRMATLSALRPRNSFDEQSIKSLKNFSSCHCQIRSVTKSGTLAHAFSIGANYNERAGEGATRGAAQRRTLAVKSATSPFWHRLSATARPPGLVSPCNETRRMLRAFCLNMVEGGFNLNSTCPTPALPPKHSGFTWCLSGIEPPSRPRLQC